MREVTEENLRSLTSRQAGALVTLIEEAGSLSGAIGLSGRPLGGILSALSRKSLIKPLGREKRQFRWEIGDPDLKADLHDNRREVLRLLNKIARQ